MAKQQGRRNQHGVWPGGLTVINLHRRKRHKPSGDESSAGAAQSRTRLKIIMIPARENRVDSERMARSEIGRRIQSKPAAPENRLADVSRCQDRPDMPPVRRAGDANPRRRIKDYVVRRLKELIASPVAR